MARIAYTFFGQVKNFDEKQYSAFQENVASKLGDFDVDYFLVTSKANFYSNARHAESEPGVSKIDYKSIEKYFDFKEVYYDQDARDGEDIDGLCESVIKFGEAWKEGNPLESLKNSIKQIYSLEYFYDKFSHKIADYDYFILSRSDLCHTHPLNIDCFSGNEDLFAPYYDVCPQIDYGWFGGINDRFAVIKNEFALKTYCTRYSSIKNNPEYYHAEQYLLKQLKTNNVNYGKIHNFMFLLNRASGKLSDFVGIQPDEKMNTNLKAISKSYFINLDRRTDRLHHMLIKTPFFTERFSAVDSKQMQLTDEVKKLFPKTWQKRTKAEICCAISHYRLWQKLIADRDAKNYLILEDDTVFKPGFENFWNQVYSDHIPKNAFLIYLGGCQPWNKPEYHKVLQRHNDYFCTVKKNDYFTKDDHFWHMNANSYILSKQAANLMCQWVEQFGMDETVDNFMQNFFNENKLFAAPELVFHLNPLMSYQLHEENDNPEIDKKSDLRFAEEMFFAISGRKFIDKKAFPNLQTISSNQIPKKIHLSWKNKNVLDSHYELIRKGAKNLELLNPDWDVQVYDDEDVNRLLRDSIGRDNWNLIKDKKITEKTDLWRLLKTYKEGGLYVDIDKYIDTPLSEVVNHKTSCVLPTFQDVDFSQDFILTCAKNPIIGRAIANNLNYRKQGKPLFFLAVYSYMQSVCEILGTKIIDRGNNPEYFNDIRKKINQCEYLETYREIGPEHHTLFRNIDKQFDTQTFEKDKADFYNGEDVVHWNSQTQAFHASQKIKKQKLIFTQNNLFEQDFICELFEGFDVVINEDMNIVEQDSVVVYSDMYAKNINAYPQKFRENLNQLRAKQKEYFEQCKNKNCILVHLSDEHCHAEIDHYKNFKHVFRQYYRKDAVADNVTFIPLGYKKGFCGE